MANEYESKRATVKVLRADNFLVIQTEDDIYYRKRKGALKHVVGGTNGLMQRTDGDWTFIPDPPKED